MTYPVPVAAELMRRVEHVLERASFVSRWLLAPFYVGRDGAGELLRPEAQGHRRHRCHLRHRAAEGLLQFEPYTNDQLVWKAGLPVTFMVSGVLFAEMDPLTNLTEH